MRFARSLLFSIYILACFALCTSRSAMAQSETATISGHIVDASGAVVHEAAVELESVQRGTTSTTTTNDAGIYIFPSVPPGQYSLTVRKQGFKQVDLVGVIANVQEHIEQNFRLEVGSTSESVTVSGDNTTINTTDASVSTVIDRQFADNLPLNGRSFQSLVYLTPGVTPNIGGGNSFALGQFSVNGQSAANNYWSVDGVSANAGASTNYFSGNISSGNLGSANVLGSTTGLVSVDALQEFRVQTSTYAPEFGRTPGGQISIVTRAGTNQFHGSVFDYLRNTVLDANNWFNGFTNDPPLPKAAEKQNDFGGTVGGPIFKDKTFFFFSYEGVRLRLPQTALTTVPDLTSRQNAIPAVQPFINAYPLPNGPEDPLNPGSAAFNASFSNPGSVDAYSIRIDQAFGRSWTLFGRYNDSPSNLNERVAGFSANTITSLTSNLRTITGGATWTKSPSFLNEVRLNYSRAIAWQAWTMDTFGGGAVAPGSSLFPSPYTYKNGIFALIGAFGNAASIAEGQGNVNTQHMFNLVDTVSLQEGTHSIKVGVDYRRLTPSMGPTSGALYEFLPIFSSSTDLAQGNSSTSISENYGGATFLLNNLSVFAQDSWRATPRLTATYGLRWDVDFTPSTENRVQLPALTGFSTTNLANLALAPAGTPIYQTQYGNVAPRVGIAYQAYQGADWGTVIRTGFGVFYNLASSEIGNQQLNSYPFYASAAFPKAAFPPSAEVAALAPMEPPSATNGTLFGFDPHLKAPYSLQWSAALEQSLGKSQTFTASYVGSTGKQILLSETVAHPNENFLNTTLVSNAGNSNYNALQLQFQRRLAAGLQTLASYTWAHAIDTGTYGEYANGGFANVNANRGPSDFDVRNAFSAALTYELPAAGPNMLVKSLVGGWSTDNIIQVRSTPPVDVIDGAYTALSQQNTSLLVRPDLVAGQPLYLHGSQFPGGKALNPAAFTNPPTVIDPVSGLPTPTRQGDLGRNALRGFGLTQWDFAVHREFPIHERLRAQFRAEMFNVLNHPNFASYNATFGTNDPFFGQSTGLLATKGIAVNGGGGLSSLYQLGGPRSVQLALKVSF
jgi:Carboxypeptidase regulatory-like domain/TonB dependent receptor-like, beta-barrel